MLPAGKYGITRDMTTEGSIAIQLHKGDLPSGLVLKGSLAVDTEAMGLNNLRDRLCLVQLCDEEGSTHLVQFARGAYDAPNLCALLADPARVKIFHFARFDVAILKHYLGVLTQPVYCTKIASKLARTYTDRHGFKEICRELLGAEVSKYQQSSDWGADTLTPEQMEYAATDVIHLHALKARLDIMLEREGRTAMAHAACAYLPARAELDLAGWAEVDIFAHS